LLQSSSVEGSDFGAKATPVCVVDGARTIEAFNWYLANEQTSMGREETEKRLRERLRDPSFRNDMETLLRPGFGPYDINVAAELVREKYFVHLR
jgi:hypothetical protein